MQDNRIEQLVKKIAQQQMGQNAQKPVNSTENNSNWTGKASEIGLKDYPLAQKRPELVNGITGKGLDFITLEKVMNGEIKPEDIRISSQVLEYQAQVAEANGKKQFALNLRRAAEMTRIPDDKVLEIYELLRPRRSTKQKLLSVSEELESKYKAPITAKLVREAAEVYAERNILETT